MVWIYEKNQDVRAKSQDLTITQLTMKNLFFIIAIISIVFMSCDGRKSKNVALKESIKEFRPKESNSELVTYYPKEYTEVVTDTILSNQVKVRIRNYSLNNEAILISDESSPTKIKYHRVFESDVLITAPSRELFKTHISAIQFASINPDEFWDNATLQHVWLNEELSTIEDIQLEMSFINPNNESYKLFRMTVDKVGKQQIALIEENS